MAPGEPLAMAGDTVFIAAGGYPGYPGIRWMGFREAFKYQISSTPRMARMQGVIWHQTLPEGVHLYMLPVV